MIVDITARRMICVVSGIAVKLERDACIGGWQSTPKAMYTIANNHYASRIWKAMGDGGDMDARGGMRGEGRTVRKVKRIAG